MQKNPVHYKHTPYMKGDKTQLRTPQIRPYPLQEKFKILFLGGYVYDVTNSTYGTLSLCK